MTNNIHEISGLQCLDLKCRLCNSLTLKYYSISINNKSINVSLSFKIKMTFSLFKAVLAFIALPGMFAGVIPALIVQYQNIAVSNLTAGLCLIVPGVLVLLWCVHDFLVSGHGTLAPWDPPKKLVVTGLYQYSRNPMYVSVILIISGWIVLFFSILLAVYGLILGSAFYLRVIFGEEPALTRQFGDQWLAYSKNVPRWLPNSLKF